MATTDGAAFGGDIGEQRFAVLFDRHKRHLAWLGVALLVAVIGAWFYIRSNALKEQHAEQAYEAALQSVASGNIPLAQSDLRKVAVRYPDTNGGTQAAMALAKLYYEAGKYQQGLDVLKGPASGDGDLAYGARLLLGDGWDGLGKPAEAARAFEDAATKARFDADRATARARAARAYQEAGNAPAAIKIWTDLVKDPKSGFTAEANIRLGELEAKALKV